MTLEGARKAMKGPAKEITRDAELLERLQRIRSELVEVRESLKVAADEQIVESASPAWEEADESKSGSRQMRQGKAVTVIESGDKGEVEEKPKRRAPRRKKADEEKELFPFYEQSLF